MARKATERVGRSGRGSQSPGSYTVSWDGRNHAGNVVARGIYFIRFVGPDNIDQEGAGGEITATWFRL